MADDDLLPSVAEFSSDVSTQEAPPALPPGMYPAVVTAAVLKRSKSNPDNVLLDLEFTIDPSAFPPDFTENSEPQKLHWMRNTVNKDTARERFQLRQLGEKLRVHIGRKLDANDFMGKQANLKVKNEPYQGMNRASIDAIEAA
jgi:hypothetical protein